MTRVYCKIEYCGKVIVVLIETREGYVFSLLEMIEQSPYQHMKYTRITLYNLWNFIMFK